MKWGIVQSGSSDDPCCCCVDSSFIHTDEEGGKYLVVELAGFLNAGGVCAPSGWSKSIAGFWTPTGWHETATSLDGTYNVPLIGTGGEDGYVGFIDTGVIVISQRCESTTCVNCDSWPLPGSGEYHESNGSLFYFDVSTSCETIWFSMYPFECGYAGEVELSYLASGHPDEDGYVYSDEGVHGAFTAGTIQLIAPE